MVMQRKINYGKYIAGLLIALFFVLSGIFIGNLIAEKRADDLLISQKAISALLSLSSAKANCTFINNSDYCSAKWAEIWQEKVEIGSVVSYLENRLGKENLKVLEQKRVYNEIQIKTLSLVEGINSACQKNWTIILFFYTNKAGDSKGDAKLSELQGYALDTLYSSNKEQIKIFSFDINAGDAETASLLEKYAIKSLPSLVIDGKVYQKFMGRNEIQKIINE